VHTGVAASSAGGIARRLAHSSRRTIARSNVFMRATWRAPT
jgi:hypothetical protein